MTPVVAVFVVVSALALLLLPRRWAALPLIVGACYMTRSQTIELGVATFTVVRILVFVGLIRLLIRREWIAGGVNRLDVLMLAWGIWMVLSGAFHDSASNPFVQRARDVFDAWGLYGLFRVFCRDLAEVQQLSKILALALFPIGVAMLVEKVTGVNPFAQFGGVGAVSMVREGVIRAQGPFAHPILAGSIGGVTLPLVAGLWRDNRMLSTLGVAGSLAMVIASGSSGPILTAAAGVMALMLWRMRLHMRLVRWTAVLAYLALDLVMTQPGYFIITYIDITGGSTSWWRAQLVRMAFAHLDEWWLVGTDYTRHWMPTGIQADANSADIVNHYIANGVQGGLLLMLMFVALFVIGFGHVGSAIRSNAPDSERYRCWVVGSALFAHAATCLSVSYYDHSILFLYLTLAATTATLSVGAVQEVRSVALAPADEHRPSRYRRHAMIPQHLAALSGSSVKTPLK